MPNHAYASIWRRDFSEEMLAERFEQFLSTVPMSATRPGFTDLVIRALSPAEMPLIEPDLRLAQPGAAEIAELAREHLHSDSAYETRAYWDLWAFDAATGNGLSRPEPLEIFCYGEEYDDGVWKDYGHFHVDLGLEHLFTGHARLLGFGNEALSPPEHPAEAKFLEVMSQPANLREYQEKTRENIRKVFDWMQRIEGAVPVERTRLWSEGEENFEARIEEILAVG